MIVRETVNLQKGMHRFILVTLIALLCGCEKYSTPNRLSRIIVRQQWKITDARIDNVDRTADFQGKNFSFLESGAVSVGDPTISGTWTTGNAQNPAILELTLTPFEPYNVLNADWSVVKLKRNEMTLELNTSNGKNEVILTSASQ